MSETNCFNCNIESNRLTTVFSDDNGQHIVCLKCLKNYSVCDGCSNYVIDEEITFMQDLGKMGRNYCSQCLDTLDKCSECECNIDREQDDFEVTDHQTYCISCYSEIFKDCLYCDNKFDTRTSENKFYCCELCYEDDRIEEGEEVSDD